MKISELVKLKRKELNESQAEFGKRFGLSHAAISDMESSKTGSITETMLNFVLDGDTKPCPGYCDVCMRHCQLEQVTRSDVHKGFHDVAKYYEADDAK